MIFSATRFRSTHTDIARPTWPRRASTLLLDKNFYLRWQPYRYNSPQYPTGKAGRRIMREAHGIHFLVMSTRQSSVSVCGYFNFFNHPLRSTYTDIARPTWPRKNPYRFAIKTPSGAGNQAPQSPSHCRHDESPVYARSA